MSEYLLIITIILIVVVLIGLLLVLVVWRQKKAGITKETNYQAFFTIGIVWLPIGVVFMTTINPGLGCAFICIGAVYLAIGLANRDKWRKK